MIREYKYHNWSQYMIDKHELTPSGPHFAALLFSIRRECDSYDGTTWWDVHETTYFAFSSKELLIQWITEVQADKRKFFFFEVKKIGSLEVKVEVETDL